MRKIFVGPKDVAQTLIKMGKTHHVISIIDPTEPPLMDVPGDVRVCTLIFNDLNKTDAACVNKAANRLKLCSKRDAEKALIFAATVPQSSLLVIHCGAGVSRSPAIGLGVALQDAKECSGQLSDEQIHNLLTEFFNRYPCASPNPLVLEYVEEILECQGRLAPRVNAHVRSWIPDQSYEFLPFQDVE